MLAQVFFKKKRNSHWRQITCTCVYLSPASGRPLLPSPPLFSALFFLFRVAQFLLLFLMPEVLRMNNSKWLERSTKWKGWPTTVLSNWTSFGHERLPSGQKGRKRGERKSKRKRDRNGKRIKGGEGEVEKEKEENQKALLIIQTKCVTLPRP